MKHALIALFLSLPLAAAAQDYEPPSASEAPRDSSSDTTEPGDLGSLIEDGAESFFKDLLRDIEPQMNAIGRELGSRVTALGPVFDDLVNLMDDIKNYQAPERLANGDILIRRKPGAPPPPVVSEKFQDLTKPAPEDDPRINPPLGGAPEQLRPDENLPEDTIPPAGPQIEL